MSETLLPTPRELAEQWLAITVERFAGNMRRLRIHQSGALLASFRTQVIGAAGSDRLQLQLSYALYGKFVDMGVGRGMGKGLKKGDDGYDRVRNTRGQLKRHVRRAKPWYSKEIAHQSHRLSELLLDLYGTVALARASDAVAGELTINL